MAILEQAKHLSSLRRSCDLEWKAQSLDWEKSIYSFSQTIFTATLMGIAWTFIISMIKICVSFNEGQGQYN